MSSNNFRYVTGHRGPPNGGKAPGMSQAPPPAYTLQAPMTVATIVHHLAPGPVFPSIPTGPPKTSSNRPSVPGETLDGKKIQFDDGSTYLFPKDYTSFHLVADGKRPWEIPGKEFEFTTYKVPCTTTVRDMIAMLGIPVTSTNKLGIAEILETGGGAWKRGTTFVPLDKDFEVAKLRKRLGGDAKEFSTKSLENLLPDDRCDQTIKDVGWTEKAGKTKKPIWLAVFKG